jgi:hypothetical protein
MPQSCLASPHFHRHFPKSCDALFKTDEPTRSSTWHQAAAKNTSRLQTCSRKQSA